MRLRASPANREYKEKVRAIKQNELMEKVLTSKDDNRKVTYFRMRTISKKYRGTGRGIKDMFSSLQPSMGGNKQEPTVGTQLLKV